MARLAPASIRATLQRSAPHSVPEWRKLRRVWSHALSSRPAHEVIKLATALVDDGFWQRVTAYELIAHHPDAMAALTPASIRRLARGLADWGSVDAFACGVAGPAWREARLPTRQIHAWIRSKNRWERRLGVVCTVALNVRARGGRGDVARTLDVCRRVADDRDDMVVKALSWALRSLVAWDREAVAAFVAEHETALAGRVKREVGTKLRTGRKNS